MESRNAIEHLKDCFKNPPASSRTAPLWVWNDLMTEEIIDFQLKELKDHGFGGAFVHPRPGLITEYLSEEWFQKWDYALQSAKRLGMKLYIYDENSYPSGFAGGHVSSQLPDCLSISATCNLKHISEIKSGSGSGNGWFVDNNFLKAYACHIAEGDKENIKLTQDLTNIPQEQWYKYGEWFMILELQDPQTTTWLGEFANVNLLRPEVTEAFLETTYEAYYKKFGQYFGKDIPAIFTDEPAITVSRLYNSGRKNVLPFSYWFASEFETRNGYNLFEYLPALFKDVKCEWFKKDVQKIRYDYYCTVQELWTENFVKPIAEWCSKRGIAWTGHYLEHHWPFAAAAAVSPCIMSNYEYHQWPAIDMLMTYLLKNEATDLLLITILELKSAANQFGKERTLCETYGAGGWDSTMEDYKRIGDWLMVNGVNFINQHLTYGTVVGARKRDHPQSFDWREPWWDDYTELNDYTARVSTMLIQGKATQRILVLHPTTTGFLISPEGEEGNIFAGNIVTNPDMRSYLNLIQRLTDEQLDFDLGDEYILERHAIASDGHLILGQQCYDVILVSGI